jgi:hypothetical protein
MAKETIFLVVKCGNIKSHHAANELDEVIKTKGFAWFAKYGAKIKLNEIKLDDPIREYALCLCLFIENKYQLFTYRIIGCDTKTRPTKGTYPAYYKEKISFINTWIKVSSYNGVSPTVNDLIVKSSLNKLSDTLRKSTSGHFFCRK